MAGTVLLYMIRGKIKSLCCYSGGQKFHKRCLKCESCSRKLDSNSVAIVDQKLFCILCMKKNRTQESPKIYPDTKAIAPSDEKGCPR